MREHNRDKERLEHIAEGFTARNLWHMKQWYLFYSRPEYEQKLKQAVSQFEGYTNTHPYPILFIKYMTK